ncbi:MAG: DUF3372 domain-containing protein [Hellea sp.]|nr:DUF3372 domain-containing protein [Hellea sp.]
MSKFGAAIIVSLSVFIAACSGSKSLDIAEVKKFASANIIDSAAHWISSDIILLPKSSTAQRVHLIGFSKGLKSNEKPARFQLKAVSSTGSSDNSSSYFQDWSRYQLTANDNDKRRLLSGEVVVIGMEDDAIAFLHHVQTPGAIDDIYTSGPNDADEIMDYGVVVGVDKVSFRLWAPTARSAKLELFDGNFNTISTKPMTLDATTGSWHTDTNQENVNSYYRYQIKAYHPSARKVETYSVTDPYSLGLSANGEFSLIVDLNDPATKPDDWDNHKVPLALPPNEQIFYAAHVGDFSGTDLSTPAADRGKFNGFTNQDTAPVKHLQDLAETGITTFILDPVFDYGAVNEIEYEQVTLDRTIDQACITIYESAKFCDTPDRSITLRQLISSFDPNTGQASEVIKAIQNVDDYSAGIGPVHYSVPEGSYASDPDGLPRIVEFRRMVMALHNMGLQVDMKVSYDKAYHIGMDGQSVLDKTVPNYYLERDPFTGEPIKTENDTKLSSDRSMMSKLKKDSLNVWTNAYKIDGFHHGEIPPRKLGTQWDSLQYDLDSKMELKDRLRQHIQIFYKDLLNIEKPVILMGDEILRSNSMWMSSGNAGHWFNAVDFTYQTNNFNVGIPPNTDFIDKEGRYVVSPEDIQFSLAVFKDILRLRKSSSLLTLSGADSERRVRIDQISASEHGRVFVTTIDNGFINSDLDNIDSSLSQIIIVQNESSKRQTVKIDQAGKLRLHPVQTRGADKVVRQSVIALDHVTVPGYTTAVFVRPE